MLLSSVNIIESIRKDKLVYNWDALTLFESFFTYLCAIMFIAIITTPAIIKPANIWHVAVWYIVVCVLVDSWILLNLIFMHKLVKVKGDRTDTTKEQVKIVLGGFYTKLDLEEADNFILRYVKPAGFFTGWYVKVITVLFSGNLIYINIVAFGRGESTSIFHGMSNYFMCKRIAKRFLELQNKEA